MRSANDYYNAAKESMSLSDMCRYFDILPLGGNIDTMKHAIARYNVDVSHFKSNVIIQDNHGKKFNRNKTNKKILIELFGYKCSNPKCGIYDWNKEKLTLQVEHIDGNNTNDSIDNLRLLCPNCHYETDTYCVSSNVNTELSGKCICGNKKLRASKSCSECIKNNYEVALLNKPYKYKKEHLENIVANSVSFKDAMNKLGKRGGGSQKILVNAIRYYKIDISHFTGQAWSKGKSLVDNPKTKHAWKNKLVIERGHKCENCNRTHWVSGNLIPLELEHVDGNNKNNVRSNLKLLCCNCHSQTKTWKRKKSALNKPQNKCLDCNQVISSRAKRCVKCFNEHLKANSKTPGVKSNSKMYKPKYDLCLCGKQKLSKSPRCEACYKKSLERTVWPDVEELKSMVAESSYSAVGRLLGVSDNAVRKRLRIHSK